MQKEKQDCFLLFLCFSFSRDFISVCCHSSSLSLKASPKNIKPLSHCFSRQTSHKSS
uniref:Uncharacterized protein n=2 Tax=Accipitrinae TaxID=8955 RepID=A0A8C0C2Z2_9AVES